MALISQQLPMDVASLRTMLLRREITVQELVEHVYGRIEAHEGHHAWIYVVPKEELMRKAKMLDESPNKDALPLFGIPYGVKDNIDVAGVPTTAACKEFSYLPKESAVAVQRLEEAGGLFVGKTNLDQFATGLVGTRSPYGVVRNSFHPDFISGGSSSGSAVAVALGMVSFALGTDTAGSGRVPAGFNHLYGLKPTKKAISTRGVVPACKSLDCVSIFALSCEDAATLLEILKDKPFYDPTFDQRTLAPFVFGIPASSFLNFSGNQEYEALYHQAVEKLRQAGGIAVEVDFSSFLETADLLYEGPWLAERLASINEFFSTHADSLLLETKKIMEGGKRYSAVDTFLSIYKLEELKTKAYKELDGLDFLLVPTTPTIYTIAEIQQEPFSLNRNLGYYTNFVNLLELCALAVPNGFQSNGLPMGVTLIGVANTDQKLLRFGQLFPR